MQTRRVRKIYYVLLVGSLLISSFYLSAILLKTFLPLEAVPSLAATKPIENHTIPSVRINPPARLEITTITVNTTIKPVGMTSDGDMAIDEDIDSVAWYELGPKPGEQGSAVIAGHYGWKSGQASVFNDLHTLIAGDRVSVYDANNKPISFIVQRTQIYDPAADATEVFQSSDGLSHLNLITCEGSWNTSQQTYSQRLVVFTNKDG